jgi:hypothetical protein
MRLIFEWDAIKSRANLKKHQVGFEEARTLFSDPLMVTFADEHHSASEERLISIGRSATGRLVLVVHADHWESQDELVIRIISCRKTTASEQRTYEEDEV